VETVKQALIITIRKDDFTAYGECVAMRGPWYSEETISSAHYILRQFLIPQLFEKKFESPAQFLESTVGIRGNNMAIASVEMALWDLMGKMTGKPLSLLLGGQKSEVQVGVSVGIQPSIGELVRTVTSYLQDGYRRIKIKIKPGYEIEPVRAIRKEYPAIPLQVDANSAFSLEDFHLLKQFDAFNLLLIEQPLAHDDILDHSKLQKQLSTPICLDESIHTPQDARKALEIDACRVINIKPGRVRGLQRSKEIHDLSMRMKVPVWCGGMLETGIGRAFNVALASLPGFTLPSDISASRRYFKRDIIKKEFELTSNGTIEVSQEPGIGIEVDQERLNACTISKRIFTADQYPRTLKPSNKYEEASPVGSPF
jgi:O-succinylbenzoate synthase